MERSSARVFLVLACCLAMTTAVRAERVGSGATGPVPPLGSAGRWFTDAVGRVVTLHGVNEVAKSPPYYPAADGFGDDDAAFLASEGFSAVRLGIDLRGLMPAPGVIEASYIEHIAESVDALAAHRLFVLLDIHQDGFSPMFNGNGFPDWMAISDGLPNPPDAVFPLYYIQNPAMQRAFEHFWANSPGPDGVGLQDAVVRGAEVLTRRFADNPWVMGLEPMNEPWPGADWQPCVTNAEGCPDLESTRLRPFYARMTSAVRAIAPGWLVLVEPFVLFNFGRSATSIPGGDSGNALSFHSYALDVTGEEGVVAHALAAAERDQVPLFATEFGSSIDPVLLTRLTAQMDTGIIPWLFWAYNGEVIARQMEPAGPDNVRSLDALAALVRPYPLALTGTPTTLAFDPTTGRFELTYRTARPGGGRYARKLTSVVSLPVRQYPEGYTVAVRGAKITSRACAPLLTVRSRPYARVVTVRVTRGRAGGCPGHRS